MKKKILILALLMFAFAACEAEVDCRQKAMECADGFACEEARGGASWECVKAEPPEVRSKQNPPRPEPRPQAPNGVTPEPGRPPGPAPCMKHPMCGPRATECVCNPAGKIVSRSLDRTGDGKADEKATYDYDGEGHLAAVLVDEGPDGKPDSKHRYEYDVRGNPLVWEILRLDGGAVKEDEQRITYVYDDKGNLTQENVDSKLDGTVDRKCTFDPPCPPPIPNRDCSPVCK